MKLPVDEKDTKLEFEMSELYEGVCGLSGCGGLPASIADATFYYDESGNAHHVVVQGGKDLNLKKAYIRIRDLYGKEDVNPRENASVKEECQKIAKNYWKSAKIQEFEGNSHEYLIRIEKH